MGNLFGKQLTPKEMLQESQAALRQAIRELEREREKMQREEKRLQIEIKQGKKHTSPSSKNNFQIYIVFLCKKRQNGVKCHLFASWPKI